MSIPENSDHFIRVSKERISENLKAAPMLDIHRAEGTFIAWGFFLILIMILGAFTCNVSKDPSVFKAMSVFISCMLTLLAVTLITSIRNKRKILMLLQSGILTTATITKRHEVKKKEYVIPSYFYLCQFEAPVKNGITLKIEAALPKKIADPFKIGDTLKIFYSPNNPRLCIEDPSDPIRRDLLSTRAEGNLFAIGIICLCITFWGLSAVVSESIAQSTKDSSPGEWMYHFFRILFSHSSDRSQIEIILFLISIGVLGCAVYLLLYPASQKNKYRKDNKKKNSFFKQFF